MEAVELAGKNNPTLPLVIFGTVLLLAAGATTVTLTRRGRAKTS